MYATSSDELWTAVVSFFKERKFKFEEYDETDRVIVTRWTVCPSKRFRGFEPPPRQDGYTTDRIKFTIHVPRKVDVARLHLGSIATFAQRLTGKTRHVYAWDDVDHWLLAQINDLLGMGGLAIPAEHATRMALIQEVSKRELRHACDDVEGPVLLAPGVSPPQAIPATKLIPVYPGEDARRGRKRIVSLYTLIDEAGFVAEVSIVDSKAAESEFEISALQTVKLWRFRPAMKGGCAIAIYWPVYVDFGTGRLEK